MADEIGFFTPEQARLIWQDYQTRQQLAPQISQNFPQRRTIDEPSPHRVFVRNDSSETIPPYGCMQITGTDTIGGRTVVKVVKPTDTDGEYLINSQFEIPVAGSEQSGCGWAYRFGVVIFIGDAPSGPTPYQPIVDSWEVEEGEGGPFVIFGEHNATEKALIGRFAAKGGGGGATIEYKIDSTTIHTSGPYTGLKVAFANVKGAPCDRPELLGTSVEVVDHSNCLFDEDDMSGYTGWAQESIYQSLEDGKCGEDTPCHWAAINRCCSPNSSGYTEDCA